MKAMILRCEVLCGDCGRRSQLVTWDGSTYCPGCGAKVEAGVMQEVGRGLRRMELKGWEVGHVMPFDSAVVVVLRSEGEDIVEEVVEPDEGEAFTCEVCGFEAKSAFGLRAHMRRHGRG